MAASTNGSGNLVDEFEEAFQTCINALTKDENQGASDKDEVRNDVDQTVLRFLDTARQMESFFLQKRFLLSALKPELIVKEDTNELRLELGRKDELIKKHSEKIVIWQNLLADLQGGNKSPAQGGPPQPTTSQAGPPINQQPNMQPNQPQLPLAPMPQAAQLVTPPVGLPHTPPVSQSYLSSPGLGPPSRIGFPGVQQPPGHLQGPLAYLEKTASNIGIPDGRR